MFCDRHNKDGKPRPGTSCPECIAELEERYPYVSAAEHVRRLEERERRFQKRASQTGPGQGRWSNW